MQSRYLRLGWGTYMLVFAGVLLFASLVMIAGVTAGQQPAGAPAIDDDDIGGVVTGARGPEAGVWVIAETRSTPTRLIKSVVTDDRGRYLVPDLPKANYDVWVRGYGLVDSPKVKAAPGKVAEPQGGRRARQEGGGAVLPGAVLVRADAAAAEERLPRHRRDRATASRRTSRARASGSATSSTPTAAPAAIRWAARRRARFRRASSAQFEDSKAAWDRRIQSGQAGGGMSARFTQVGRAARARRCTRTGPIASRRASCRRPTPPRPQGRERNVVITMWDWADPKVYLHDEIASDKRNPTVNANGPIYGALEESGDYLPVVDPKTNTASQIKLIVARSGDAELRRSAAGRRRRRTGATKRSGTARRRCTASRWTSRAACGSRRASASRRRRPGAARDRIIRRRSCSRSTRASADCRCTTRRRRQVTTIDTCFTWGHLNFDDNDVLWSSFGPAGVEGWFDTKIWDKTHDEKAAQGWTRVRPRQQRQRQARRLHRAESAGRSDEGQAASTSRSTATRRRPTDRSGERCRACRARSVASCPERIRRRRRSRRSTKCRGTTRRRRRRASRRAAWTSTATASSGRCSRADSSRASIAASARGRSTVRRRPASTAPKAGRSIRCRVRTTRARSTARAPTRRTTTSSIASTCSASARTCRSRPATCPKGCSRWSTASS